MGHMDFCSPKFRAAFPMNQISKTSPPASRIQITILIFFFSMYKEVED